jgi:hypothetical protein
MKLLVMTGRKWCREQPPAGESRPVILVRRGAKSQTPLNDGALPSCRLIAPVIPRNIGAFAIRSLLMTRSGSRVP